MRTLQILTPFFACCLLLAAAPLHAADAINISVPASMTDVVKELAERYKAAGKEVAIVPNFGPSGALAKQIDEGAPADLFISANQKWMTYLRDAKKIEPQSEKILAVNTLVFVGAKNPAVTKLADIVGLKRIAIGSPKSVPAGEYAAQAMEKAGIYKQLEEGQKLVMAKDVRQSLIYADRGEADGAFVYKTDALMATQAVILFEVPQDLYDQVTYPIALTANGAKQAEAKAFYDFLTGPEALKVFLKYGFSAPK
ncbi:MAG: molybdate ABC transporter substrate-binding protein [Desulfobulbus sp.]|jgi:molybdate transport system substrate-binding protein|uniref:molybdate ABC transporter substrate-binding protein n=1 Tax=Desulfobulbus sp. TaxID=895 RepID=UPI00283E796A|nr:molybdate ABC transporter substrate-binding protein [Desulfobulbus sp.]MDR2550999.1 molybdate ABC transporter substrate-binding protein [Desulfobulbus sp.]